MQGFNFVAPRKLGVSADPFFRKHVSSVTVCENTTPHSASDDHHNIIMSGVVISCLLVSGPET
jgi:hypothetical protein